MVQVWHRLGVAVAYTIGLAIIGMMYGQVFSTALLPLINPDGPFSAPAFWLDAIVPMVVVVLLVVVWGWVVAGAVQEEQTIATRRRL